MNRIMADFESIAVGRTRSLFEDDLRANRSAIETALKGRRIAVIGAAGSIGFSVVKNLLAYKPKSMALFDLSENNLVEVVRDLRSTPSLRVPDDFEALPIGIGSGEFARYIDEKAPFDFILNLSAIKHVRSEKDVYSLIRMVNTNVLFVNDFLRSLSYRPQKFFSVSSDKATNPHNLMGATKMFMEEVHRHHGDKVPFSSARFANVAFSDGSLPYSFLRRIEKRQPLVAPNDVRRFFISHEEAGQLCLLSCALGENAEVFYPKLEAGPNEKTFVDIAIELLDKLGYEPELCSSEDDALARSAELIDKNLWPCYFSTSNTTGEKGYEEFFTPTDALDEERYVQVGVIKRQDSPFDAAGVAGLLEFLYKARGDKRATKREYVEAFAKVIPGFSHSETGRNLDQKM